MKRITMILLALGILIAASPNTAAQLTDEMKNDGWVAIFDGTTLDGWKANDRPEDFYVEDGAIVGRGGRNHLYFMEELGNFELKIDCKINKGGNSGVFVKSQWQENAWPTSGFELQVNNSHSDPVKTGSLYDVIKIFEAPHNDDEWFTYHIKCNRNTLEVRVNDKLLYIYECQRSAGRRGQGQAQEQGEAAPPITPQTRRISQRGYIALQQHDPGSVGMFKNIYLRKLP